MPKADLDDLSPELVRLDCSRSGPGVRAPVLGGAKLRALVCTKCESLVDEAVSGACDRSPVLGSLMLALCVTLFSPRIHGENLAEITLSGCNMLQDAAVTHASMHCPRLAKLSLSLCAALVEPYVAGPMLRRVVLSHAEQLSRPTIGGPALEELTLTGCTRMEDTPLEQACAGSPRLRTLKISGCVKLQHARLASGSLRTLECDYVAREVVDHAADRLRCPLLSSIGCEAYVDPEGFEEVD